MAASANSAGAKPRFTITPPHFLADLYTFKWTKSSFRMPLISAGTVSLCLFAGVFAGHPGAGLIAGGGAFTVGFGPNQRINDSRLTPMISAVLGVTAATLVGTLAGHHNYTLVVAAAICAYIYGELTARHTGLAWVAQQSSIALLVASAFPTGPGPALERAGLLAAGGVLQLVITTAGLHRFRSLQHDALSIPMTIYQTIGERDREMVRRLRLMPKSLPPLPRFRAFIYSMRLAITVAVATEIYRLLGIQSGYWIPMTALLVQKPAFFETVGRAATRVAGTLAGAYLCSLLIMHTAPQPWVLALMTALFAMASYVTNPVNYGLFTGFLTGYIVFLLSLNEIPGPLLAQRRAWCTVLGAVIAIVIHLDALRRHRPKRWVVKQKPDRRESYHL
jgi:hypothetical protein